jgi:hypothetical protein
LTSSAAGTVEMLTKQLDKISTRKSSMAGYTAPAIPMDLTGSNYLNKVAITYNQTAVIRKKRSLSRNNKKD